MSGTLVFKSLATARALPRSGGFWLRRVGSNANVERRGTDRGHHCWRTGRYVHQPIVNFDRSPERVRGRRVSRASIVVVRMMVGAEPVTSVIGVSRTERVKLKQS